MPEARVEEDWFIPRQDMVYPLNLVALLVLVVQVVMVVQVVVPVVLVALVAMVDQADLVAVVSEVVAVVIQVVSLNKNIITKHTEESNYFVLRVILCISSKLKFWL